MGRPVRPRHVLCTPPEPVPLVAGKRNRCSSCRAPRARTPAEARAPPMQLRHRIHGSPPPPRWHLSPALQHRPPILHACAGIVFLVIQQFAYRNYSLMCSPEVKKKWSSSLKHHHKTSSLALGDAWQAAPRRSACSRMTCAPCSACQRYRPLHSRSVYAYLPSLPQPMLPGSQVADVSC